MKYEDYLNENIFDKIGMINTGYDHSDQILKNRAGGYKNNATSNADFARMSIPHAAGGIVIKDNNILMICLIDGNNKGLWMLPGSFVEPGESIEEAAIKISL